MNILAAQQTWPFNMALLIMIGLSILEGIGLLLSHSPSHMLDGLLPDHPDGFDGVLGWLHIGKVPLLILVILLLAGFVLAGYLIQSIAFSLSGQMLSAWLASIPAAMVGLLITGGVGGLIGRWIPQDQSSAVSEQTLIGRTGVVMRGIARSGFSAEAKVSDTYGRTHYVMVEPDEPDQVFEEGTKVLLIKKIGVSFRCIRNPHPELL
jgi:membrane protein implicated in regulation of membrane protease activity